MLNVKKYAKYSGGLPRAKARRERMVAESSWSSAWSRSKLVRLAAAADSAGQTLDSARLILMRGKLGFGSCPGGPKSNPSLRLSEPDCTGK